MRQSDEHACQCNLELALEDVGLEGSEIMQIAHDNWLIEKWSEKGVSHRCTWGGHKGLSGLSLFV